MNYDNGLLTLSQFEINLIAISLILILCYTTYKFFKWLSLQDALTDYNATKKYDIIYIDGLKMSISDFMKFVKWNKSLLE